MQTGAAAEGPVSAEKRVSELSVSEHLVGESCYCSYLLGSFANLDSHSSEFSSLLDGSPNHMYADDDDEQVQTLF